MAGSDLNPQSNISGWPGIRLSAGDVSVGLVPSVGGRIMSFTFRGTEVFYIPDRCVLAGPEPGEDLRAYKRRTGFPVLGGNKVWPAPEWDWWENIPPVDLDRGEYAVSEENGDWIMVSPVCRETGLRLTRRVSLSRDGRVSVADVFENMGRTALSKGIWNVTQVSRPFDVYLPCSPEAVRSYHYEDSTLPDPQGVPESCGMWTKVPVRSNICFKFGALYPAGAVLFLKESADGIICFIKHFPVDIARPYPHRSSVEVFNSAQWPYGEVEVHSPLEEIAPGGTASFRRSGLAVSFLPGPCLRPF